MTLYALIPPWFIYTPLGTSGPLRLGLLAHKSPLKMRS